MWDQDEILAARNAFKDLVHYKGSASFLVYAFRKNREISGLRNKIRQLEIEKSQSEKEVNRLAQMNSDIMNEKGE